MNFFVPDVDIQFCDLNDPHSMSLPSRRSEAVAGLSDPFCDQGEEYHSNGKKQADTCVPGNRGNWMEIQPQEKHPHVFEAGRESALAIDVPLSSSLFQDDEMLSWLQYPMDDTFSRSYCSEQLCEPSATSHPVQGFNLRSISQDESLSSLRSPSQLLKPLDSSMEVRTVMPETAMALGAHQAAGPLPQAGADVFSRVHGSRKSFDDASSVQGRDNVLTSLNVADNRQEGKQNAKNFSFFSQHVDAMKTSLQVLATSSGPSGKERLKQPLHTHSGEKMASVEQSRVVASLSSSSVHGESELSTERGKELMQGADTVVQQKLTDRRQCNDKKGEARVEANVWSAVVGSGILETGDVTLTSLSDGSDDSAEKTAKGTLDSSFIRKPLSEEFECDSKDATEAATPGKSPGSNRGKAAKRTRAAEIHNQSERRRRDKINAKMKALQELIPNANKTDKASMLDEAIEYVKMLQAQLQLMCIRTGLPIPSLMMPPGMQYLAAQQKPDSLQVTAGKGLGTGHVMDASSSYIQALQQRPAFLGQPWSGQDRASQWYQSSRAPLVTHGVGASPNLTNGHAVSAFQQLQPLHAPRTVKTYKSSTQEQTDSGPQHQG